MNVQGFISAMSAYDSWKASHPNASKAQLDEAYIISQSDSFINWIYQNPNGSLEYYINLIHQQQAYYNSPQYQFDMLENQIEIQTEKIEDLQNEIEELKTELSYLQDENEDLSHYNTVWSSFSIAFLIIIIFLIVVICKRTNIVKQILDKFKKV